MNPKYVHLCWFSKTLWNYSVVLAMGYDRRLLCPTPRCREITAKWMTESSLSSVVLSDRHIISPTRVFPEASSQGAVPVEALGSKLVILGCTK